MTAIIEIPQGSLHKYEVVDEHDVNLRLWLDRTLNQPCPHNYGYIKGTLAEDGDALDVFVLHDSPIHPLTEVEIEPVGMYICEDNGVADHKIVAVIKGSRYSTNPQGVAQYLATYKSTELKCLGYSDFAAAIEEITVCTARKLLQSK